MKVLLVDNYDSFTYNLAQYLGELGHAPLVRRNDRITLDEIAAFAPDRIVISPGPGRPEDAGVSVQVIRRFGPKTPVFGVCLGHQAIGHAFGGEVVRAPVLMHGKVSTVGTTAAESSRVCLSRSWPAGTIRSIVDDPPPDPLEVTARTDDGIVMGLRHREFPVSRRPVPSRVRPHGRGDEDSAQLSGAAVVTTFPELIDKLQRRVDLSVEEASAAMESIMDGRAQPAQIAGLLVGLAMKGERPDEIVGLARTMRKRATTLSRSFAPVFDTCGTGGDGAHTFNVSTVAALVLAACGVRVAKHGNRSASSRCGSADLLETLGVNVAAGPPAVERCLDEAGIAFLFAQVFHPSMKHAAATRRELGVRTAFNLLGPLTNPAGATRQLVGVPRPELTELVARSLGQLGAERAWVVHGADGLDEISTTGYTKVSECRHGSVNTFYLHPADVGLAKGSAESLKGGDAGDNAAIARSVLAGQPGPQRDIVLLNAGASLLIAGRASTIPEGIAMASEAIDTGRAAAVLRKLIALSADDGQEAPSA